MAIQGGRVVVGANLDQVGGDAYRGSAYVFERNQGGADNWGEVKKLIAADGAAGDRFGRRVAISSDTIAVGARREASAATEVDGDQTDNSADSSGAVYIFVRAGETWTQQAYLKASNAEADDVFGEVLALDGDTLVVVAFGEDSAATGVDGDQTDNSAMESGAAYVFVRNGTTWTQQAYLKASNTEADDAFGCCAVDVSGDTIVVSGVGEDSASTEINGDETDNSALSAGAAYVYVRDGTSWLQQAYLKASNAEADDRFGLSVGILGDTIAVGAFKEDSMATGINGDESDNSAPDSGAAYLFTRDGTTWTQSAYVKASNTGTDDLLSRNVVTISGDTFVVGSDSEESAATGINGDETDNSAPSAGAVYVFQ